MHNVFLRYALSIGTIGLASMSHCHPSSSSPKPPLFSVVTTYPVAELLEIPQRVDILSLPSQWMPPPYLQEARARSRAQHFSPWHQKTCLSNASKLRSSVEELLSQGIGENFLPHANAWVSEILRNAQYEVAGSVCTPGIMVDSADIRLAPAITPDFRDPGKGGNGYPFDRLQESRIPIGTPVRISHWSLDRAWALVEFSHGGGGWILARTVAPISAVQAEEMEKMPWALMLKDDHPVLFQNKTFAFHTRVGASLPFLRQEGDSVWINVPVSYQGVLHWEACAVPRQIASPGPLDFTENHLRQAVAELLDKPYGWGTYLGNRDCSALVQDFYALFGLSLPRNSAEQARAFGKTISLEKLSLAEKRHIIQEQGIPFRTLLFKPGHIGIYVGEWQGNPLLFHAPWGVSTKMDSATGRNIIGKSMITPLEYGAQVPYFDSEAGTLLQKLTAMIIL